MRVLLVGLGNMGRKYLQKLTEIGVSVVTCDIDPTKRVDGIPFYTDPEKVDVPVDRAIVATDPLYHPYIAEYLLRRNIPVLLEKPPALSIGDWERIEGYRNLFVSEIESFSVCAEYFPEDAESILIERFGRSAGYVSPLWDLAWHDLYLLQKLPGDIQLKGLRRGEIWELEGTVGGVSFLLRVSWNSQTPRRRWFIKGKYHNTLLDFGEEKVYVDGRLMAHERRDKLLLMTKLFLEEKLGDFTKKRARRNIELLQELELK
ncbi:oxidoreductase domain protein [Thermocrinis albus DSM 14484]|uniref:Oxidoreductase domain protein n=1 Tax=Thermocrinis albus (strain DSM 14484 / JCM 11386 / HI 11/12) TaxID=638303 RepID=D3SMN9_THEAH|nr:Gfo/Idh/MocA family oxidoreductase [Thermocrinis albus]ADC90019.1 oxidoreductase domain protein [Thermocrinis albus DSM 14484]